MRHTARAIILQDNHVLLVTGHGADFYWTPGGGIEPNETTLEALERELSEELGVSIVRAHPYAAYTYGDQNVDNYLVEILGPLAVGEEITDYVWYDSTVTTVKPSDGFREVLLPKLIADNLIR